MKLTIDFDNTCAFEEFPYIGDEVPYAIKTLKELQNKGHKLILWTCRSGEQLRLAVEWLNERGIILYGINDDPEPNEYLAQTYGIPRKVLGDYCIDDKNFGTPIKIFKHNGKEYRCVDWDTLRDMMIEEEIL